MTGASAIMEVAPDYRGGELLSMYGMWLWARNGWNAGRWGFVLDG